MAWLQWKISWAIVEVKAWMSNYIPYFNMDVISCPCPKLNVKKASWMLWCHPWFVSINTLRPRQNGCHFADYIFKCIFLNENVWFPIQISLTFVPKGPINYIPALGQIMAWRGPGDKPLSEPMMVSSLTHICITRPQWVNKLQQW